MSSQNKYIKKYLSNIVNTLKRNKNYILNNAYIENAFRYEITFILERKKGTTKMALKKRPHYI
jgi:hypothetical protein